ncbi:TonB-dependent receptor plug domain-containing protein [Desulfosarcina cetonica]|uniref:TonB-dependent receptor plug domain-containing protein n=1 Tax=Desulfosarcina cetonica TaxID=90730 RepID=UPI000ABE9F9B|nr:TonB-dependent receptor [Desulfosarcina cetonica]
MRKKMASDRVVPPLPDLPRASMAESSQNEVVRMDDIVVSATKTEKLITDAPGSVTVIDRQALQNKDIQTVDDALNTIAGVFIKRSKGLMDSTAAINMRGFYGDKYTLILIDGQPLNDAYTGGVDWGSIPVDNIARIEVIRGAASALYGGNAMGGVVNIITQTPEKLELAASGGYGTNATWRYRLSAGNRFGDRLSVRIGWEEQQTDGYETTPVVKTITSGTGNVAGGYAMDNKHGEATSWVVGDKGENGAKRSNLNGKISFNFSDTGEIVFTATSGKNEYDYGRPNSYMGTFGDGPTYAIAGSGQRARFVPNDFINYTGMGKNETETYALSAKELFGPVRISFQGGTVQVDDRYTTESGSGNDGYDDSAGSLKITENESWFGELRGDLPLGDAHTLTLGTAYRTDQSDTNDYNVPFYRSYSGAGSSTFYSGGNSKTWAVFAQDEWRIIDPLTLYLGLRYDQWKVYDGASGEPGAEIDYDSNEESELSPKVAAVWKALDNTTVKASVGHGFRPPTLYELYRSWTSYSTTYESNPDLKPETVWAYELGVEQAFFDGRSRLSLTGYRNDIEDLIYYRTDGSSKIRTNAGKARTLGIELEARQALTDWLAVWGNFTYTDAKITENDTDPDSEDQQVCGIPQRTWNIGADARFEWIKASLVGRYYSKIYNDSDNKDTAEGVYGTYEPAFFMDAKVTVTPLDWMEFSVSVDNIFDETYYEYYETDGCTVFAELTVRY